MQPITLPVGELRPALTGLGKLIPRTPKIPVLGAIRLHRDAEGWITLTATDLETFATVRMEQPSTGAPATILVPHAELVRVLKAQPNTGTIEVFSESAGEGASIRYPAGNQHVSLPFASIPVGEFPEVPCFDGEETPLTDEIRNSLLEALACASPDDTRHVLQGAFIDTADPSAHYLVGTDGRHLYSANSFQLPLKAPVIVPSRKFLDWRPFQADGEWRIATIAPPTAGEGSAWVRMASRKWTLVARAIDGNFPNYKQVIPNEDAVRTEIDLGQEGCAALLDLLHKLPGDDQKDQPVTVHVDSAGLFISGTNPEGSKTERLRIEGVQVKGKDVRITVNRTYVAKALRFGLTKIQLIDAISPVRFHRDGKQLIAMPLRTAATSIPTSSETSEPSEEETQVRPPAPAPNNERPMQTPATVNRSSVTARSVRSAADPTDLAPEKPSLESAIAQMEGLKSSLRETAASVNEISVLLRQAVRDQKFADKETQTVRQTLRSLQSVRL